MFHLLNKASYHERRKQRSERRRKFVRLIRNASIASAAYIRDIRLSKKS